MIDSRHNPVLAPRIAGRLCIAGGSVLVIGAAATQIAQTSTTVSDQAWSYPWSSGTSVALSVVYAFAQLQLLAGVRGLRDSGAAGATRAAGLGLAIAAAGTALIVIGHLASIPVADETLHDTGPQVAGGIFGLGTVLSAVGLLLAGRGTLRAGVWSDWRRYTPLATGLAAVALLGLQFTKVLPTAVGIYTIAFVLIGVALAVEPAGTPEPHGARAVQGA